MYRANSLPWWVYVFTVSDVLCLCSTTHMLILSMSHHLNYSSQLTLSIDFDQLHRLLHLSRWTRAVCVYAVRVRPLA